jgi:hypothetical protein
MMVYNTQNHWVYVLCPSPGIFNRVGVSTPHLKTETDPVSKMLFSSHLKSWMMDKVHKLSNFEPSGFVILWQEVLFISVLLII